MIKYFTEQQTHNLQFEDYLKMQYHSHSSLKNDIGGFQKEFRMTDKIALGKQVDEILTSGHPDINSPHYRKAMNIAKAIKEKFGDKLISSFKCQVSYFGYMESFGMRLKIKGRPDWIISGRAVLDLKVTAESLKKVESLIDFMGYDNQLFNYRGLSGCRNLFLLFYSTKDEKAMLIDRTLKVGWNSENWWSEKIMMHGE